MAHPVLTRIDFFVYKNKSSEDKAQVPVPGARVEFFSQGATCSSNVTIPPNSSGTAVNIYDTGQLESGSTIRVGHGPDARLLAVLSISSGTQIIVANPSPLEVAIAPNTRLYLISDRPLLFDDPTGETPRQNSYLTSDSAGRVVGYIAASRYDYIEYEAGVAYVGWTQKTGYGTVLSWTHGAGTGANRFILVGVAWTPVLGGSAIATAKYNSVPMTPILLGDFIAYYYVSDPPAGSKIVEIVFDGFANAAAASVEVTGVDKDHVQEGILASGSSSPATLTIPATGPGHLVVDLLSLANLDASVTATPAQTSVWNGSVGTAPDMTTGAGSRKDGPFTPPFMMSWTLTPARPWELAAIDLAPVLIAAHIDAEGGFQPSPSWLNARDFPSLADAVAALPDTGGEIFLPAGGHTVLSTLLIDKHNVTLRGEGSQATGIVSDANPDYPLVKITAANCRLLDLQIFGVGNDLGTTGACLLLEGPGVTNCLLENVELQKGRKYGLYLKDIASMVAINSQAGDCRGAGLRIERSSSSEVPTRALFLGCEFSSNDGRGVEIEAASGKDDNNIILLGCNMENNTPGDPLTDGSGCIVTSSRGIQLLSCYFEHGDPENGPPIADAASFVQLLASPGAIVDGCLFSGHLNVLYGAKFGDCPSARFTNNNGVELGIEDATSGRLVLFFESDPTNAVEFGNSEQGEEFPRIEIDGANVFGLSKGVVQLYIYEPAATNLADGALVWNDPTKSLRVVKNGTWRTVKLV